MANDPIASAPVLCSLVSQGPKSDIEEEFASSWLQGPEAETLQRYGMVQQGPRIRWRGSRGLFEKPCLGLKNFAP